MEAVAKLANATPLVERDPAYPTWEAERAALVLKQNELIEATRGDDSEVAGKLFDSLIGEGFHESHARDRADAILAERYKSRCELRRIAGRLSLIRQPVTHERMQVNRDVNNKTDDYKPRMLASLERIAESLDRIASGLNCDKRRKAGAA